MVSFTNLSFCAFTVCLCFFRFSSVVSFSYLLVAALRRLLYQGFIGKLSISFFGPFLLGFPHVFRIISMVVILFMCFSRAYISSCMDSAFVVIFSSSLWKISALLSTVTVFLLYSTSLIPLKYLFSFFVSSWPSCLLSSMKEVGDLMITLLAAANSGVLEFFYCPV